MQNVQLIRFKIQAQALLKKIIQSICYQPIQTLINQIEAERDYYEGGKW